MRLCGVSAGTQRVECCSVKVGQAAVQPVFALLASKLPVWTNTKRSGDQIRVRIQSQRVINYQVLGELIKLLIII